MDATKTVKIDLGPKGQLELTVSERFEALVRAKLHVPVGVEIEDHQYASFIGDLIRRATEV